MGLHSISSDVEGRGKDCGDQPVGCRAVEGSCMLWVRALIFVAKGM